MPRIALAALAIFLLAGPASAQDQRKWGAIAYGGAERASGTAVDYPSREEARQAALDNCEGRCTRTITFLRTCAAVAESPSGASAWQSNRFRDRAIVRAIKECGSSDCAVLAWACTH